MEILPDGVDHGARVDHIAQVLRAVEQAGHRPQ
ncbi:hypothetical protein STAFG_6496 [Streptomyces afghaniensis 772]|uniref:Uncharacterized protein n=1 Tax=Streptomyces afghaniensis 772 TaxID=1283301 RepID=S4NDU5_9ACTN|nr:hypothetical protein STAFG_6496 [Streptomyces afghaniensis 772]